MSDGLKKNLSQIMIWSSRPAALLEISPRQLLLLALALPLTLLAWLAGGDHLLARQPLIAWAAWLLAMACVLWGGRRPGELSQLKLDPTDWRIAVILFSLALPLRAIGMAEYPFAFSGDEGSSALTALQFLRGEANNPFAVGWFSFPSLYFALQGVGIALLGETVEGARITSAVAGALTVAGLYALGKIMFDRATGLVAAFYLMVSHYHIHFSRIGLNNIWDGLFLTLALAGLWWGWRSNRRIGFLLGGLALGLGQYFYVSIRVAPFLLLLWACGALWLDWERFQKRLPGLFLTAWMALIVALPLGLFFLQHPDELRAPLERVSALDGWYEREVELRGQPMWRIVADQITKAALGFTHEPLRLLYDPGAPLLLPLAGALFLLGVVWALIFFDLRSLLLFLPFISVIIFAVTTTDVPASQRYILTIPLAALLLAIPWGRMMAVFRRLWPEYHLLLPILTAVLMLAVAWVDLRYYFVEVPQSYVLGGVNTEVATEAAYYLRELDGPDLTVYFVGFPRMGYRSHSTIPFLVPQATGHDVVEEIDAPPAWPLSGRTVFIFLPERVDELERVRAAYSGQERVFRARHGGILFVAYEIGF